MRQWAILTMLFGAGVLTSAALTRNLPLAIAAIGLILLGAGDRNNVRVQLRPAAGHLVEDHRWWPRPSGIGLQLAGLALLAFGAFRLVAA